MENESDIRQTSNIPAQPIKENWRVVKLMLFFLLGSAGFLTFIIGFFWIKFKSKINKRSKFIALIIGLILYIIGPYVFHYLYTQSRYPETRQIEQTLEQQYKKGSLSVSARFSKRWTIDTGLINKLTLIVILKSRNLIDGKELLTLGQKVCSELESIGKRYDSIYVVNEASPLYPLTLPFVTFSSIQASGPCNKWLRDSEFQQSIIKLKDPRRELEDVKKRIREGEFN